MTAKEALAYLEVSRATLYRLIKAGKLAPLPKRNSVLIKEPLRFAASAVKAMRPEKQ